MTHMVGCSYGNDGRTEDMAITLHWATAQSADDTHDDISADISGVLVALVTQDAHPRDPSLGWRWCVEDWTWEPDGAWPPPEPATLAYGYVPSQQAGRTAVMGWVRQQAVAQLTLHN